MNIKAVGTNARLPAVAILRGHCSLHSSLEVGVIKNDERCVATQLERQLLYSRSALRCEQPTYTCRACERKLAHDRIAGQLRTDFFRVTRHDIEHTPWHTGPFS